MTKEQKRKAAGYRAARMYWKRKASDLLKSKDILDHAWCGPAYQQALMYDTLYKVYMGSL